MRITLQATFLETGPKARRAGVVRTVECLMEAITKRYPDHDYTALIRTDNDPAEVAAKFPSVKIAQTWPKTRIYELVGRDLDPILNKTDLFISLTGRVPRIPWVPRCSVVHDLFTKSHPEFYTDTDIKFHNGMYDDVVRYSDVAFCNSKHTAESVTQFYGRTEGLVVLPFGVPNVGNAPASDEDGAAWIKSEIPFDKYFLTLSTLEPRKNLVTLLDAWEIFCEENPGSDVGLVVVGGKGWLFDKIFEKIESMKSKDRVKLLGYVDDAMIPHLYRNASVFVLPSLVEGFGLPVLEAMHHGTLIACSNTGSLPEVGGDVPVYFDPLSARSIASGLGGALQRFDNRDIWVEKGYEQANLFSWDRCADIIMTEMTSRL